jgi:hypothetical protein
MSVMFDGRINGMPNLATKKCHVHYYSRCCSEFVLTLYSHKSFYELVYSHWMEERQQCLIS